MLRFNIVRCVFLLFYVINILFYIYEYSAAIKLRYRFSHKSYPPPPPPPPPLVGRGYILTNFWLTEEVKKKDKKEVAVSLLIKTMTYYENTKNTIEKR